MPHELAFTILSIAAGRPPAVRGAHARVRSSRHAVPRRRRRRSFRPPIGRRAWNARRSGGASTQRRRHVRRADDPDLCYPEPVRREQRLAAELHHHVLRASSQLWLRTGQLHPAVASHFTERLLALPSQLSGRRDFCDDHYRHRCRTLDHRGDDRLVPGRNGRHKPGQLAGDTWRKPAGHGRLGSTNLPDDNTAAPEFPARPCLPAPLRTGYPYSTSPRGSALHSLRPRRPGQRRPPAARGRLLRHRPLSPRHGRSITARLGSRRPRVAARHGRRLRRPARHTPRRYALLHGGESR